MKKSLLGLLLALFLAGLDAQDTPVFTIDQSGSDACYGQLYDTGGPTGDYGNNEYHVFTICPAETPTCLLFELSYYDIEFTELGITDQLLFYDGPEVNPTTLLAALGGSNFSVGTNGGGGVCYRVAASSGCLTIQFASDGVNAFTGFSGSWSCQDEECPNVEPLSLDVAPAASTVLAGLETPSASLSLLALSCDSLSYAWFRNGDRTELGLGEGLLLTTGEADYALGPNDSEGFANFFVADRGRPGDADLDSLSVRLGNGFLSQDACVLELEVSPNSNVLEFAYVFASEEYPEYVLQEYNDIFAFLVSGPGIAGIPWLDNQANIATLADGTVVEINSVNNQVNWPYFRNNNNGQGIQYDGLTADSLGRRKTLTARTEVEPCSTYTLKLAIADRGDGAFDSGVFIGKIRGGSPELALTYANGLEVLSEACVLQGNTLTISFDNPGSQSITFTTNVTGSASLNEDYLLDLPAELTFPPGTSSYSFAIEVLADQDNTEGTENIRITLTHDFGCGAPLTTDLVVDIEDFSQVSILAPDTLLRCPGEAVRLAASGPGPYRWSPASWISAPLDSLVTIAADSSGWLFLSRRRSAQCISRDSVYLDVLALESLRIEAARNTICRGDSLWLSVAADLASDSLSWSGPTGVFLGTGDSLWLQPAASAYYTVRYANGGCDAQDSIFLQVDSLSTMALPMDTLLCPGEDLLLSPPGGSWMQLAGPNPGQEAPVLSITPQELATEEDRQRTYVFSRTLGACQSQDTLEVVRLPPVVLGLDTTALKWPTTTESIVLFADPRPTVDPSILVWETEEEVVGEGTSWSFSPADFDYPPYIYVRYEDDCQQILDSVRMEYALVIMPDFFSPNEDGVNDRFQPFSPQEFDYYELQVYNRWGQQVFKYQGNQLPVWNGDLQEEAAPGDVYIYTFYARIGEQEVSKQGTVTLLR